MTTSEQELTYPELPAAVARVLSTLADAGHEAVLVGGCVRDRLHGVPHHAWDWDAATSAPPEVVVGLFPAATWENRFGTVTVMGEPAVEVTSYRTEGGYRDARRPDEVRFGASLEEDLARRDFTINAIAWQPVDLRAGRGRLIDPHGGGRDLAAGVLRTVGDPVLRFGEDALRLVRAARFAARFGMTIEPATQRAIRELAPTVATVSGERIRDELMQILRVEPAPSRALRLLEELGMLAVILPELAALRGVPQAKRVPGDALDHTLAAVDAVPLGRRPEVRLAALLHDVGKATTHDGGHFIGHDTVGAELAAGILARLRVPGGRATAVVDAVRHHMYAYDASWTDAAVRRFIRRLADVDRELLFALRRADDEASGVGEEGARAQAELEQRMAAELARLPDLLAHRRLAIDGHDLQQELGIEPGPRVGELLDRLAEAVLDDPNLNDRGELLRLARQW